MLKKSTALFWYSVCMFATVSNAVVVVKGDQENPTFSFPIGAYTDNSNDHGVCLFTGAGNTLGGDFTIAMLNSMATQFIPMAPEEIEFNNEKNQTNPFRNKSIALITSVPKGSIGTGPGEFAPVFVTSDALTTIYAIDTVYSNGSVKALSNIMSIPDASGAAETAGVLALAANRTGAVFAAVLANGESSFGVGNSGIALLGIRDSLQMGAETVKGPFLVPELTSALNVASSSLKIGNDLVSIENIIDLHWDARLMRLFVGLQVAGGAAGTDGARAVAVGRITRAQIDQNSFMITGVAFEPIAPDAVFDDATKIVGALGADAQVSMHKVRTLHVSNTADSKNALNLSYLIVQGGVGSPSSTKRSVFSLPLVCIGSASEIGTLAKKESTIKDIFMGATNKIRTAHCFNEAATASSEVFTDGDVAAQVGGGALAAGDIDDMWVLNDAVFVSVSEAQAGFKPGIFYSRAILDETDAVVAWTEWARFASVTDKAFGLFTDDITGQTTYMTGADASSIDTVKRTEWSRSGADNLSKSLMGALSIYPPDTGAIQGFADFPQNTPGLNAAVGLLASTGKGRIILGQSGNDESGSFCPVQGSLDGATAAYKNGAIDAMPPTGTRVVSIEGGALDTIGSIVAIEIANQNNNGRLFVGGVNGLGVLVDSNGDGWSAAGIGIDFEGLTAGMAFKVVGNYSFVYKIISDGNYLYVLTPNTLDRIDVTMSNFQTGDLSVVTIADISTFLPTAGSSGALCDVVVSEKFAVLATSVGIFRVGNGANIRTAANTSEVRWTLVEVPFGAGPGYTLQAISTTGLAQDFAKGAPGNLYILTTDIGATRSRISRFAIKDVCGAAVDSDTMQLLSDVYQEDTPQYFFNPGNIVQRCHNDGAITLFGRNRDLSASPAVGSIRATVPLALSTANTIVRIAKNSASGSRLVVADTGIFTNE